MSDVLCFKFFLKRTALIAASKLLKNSKNMKGKKAKKFLLVFAFGFSI
jgi:hypothetical protein